MDIKTLIAALAEVKAICKKRKSCHGCPFDLAHGCLARSTNLDDAEDYPENWAIGEHK